MASDIVQISMGDRTIGIVGLTKVMLDLAGTAPGKTDGECRELLYQGIADQNYIPPKMIEQYKDALLRAFKAFTGEAAEEVPAGGAPHPGPGPGLPQLRQDGAGCPRGTGRTEDARRSFPRDRSRRDRKIRPHGRPGTGDQRPCRLRRHLARPEADQAMAPGLEGIPRMQRTRMTGLDGDQSAMNPAAATMFWLFGNYKPK